MTYGNLEKLSFRPVSALRMKNIFPHSGLAGGKISSRALILNENPNFARFPYTKAPQWSRGVCKINFSS